MTDQQSLDQLRGTGPYPVVCGQCFNKLGFAAFHPLRDEIIFGTSLIPKTARTGGFSDIVGYQESGEQPLRPAIGYLSYSPEAKRQSKQRITASGEGRYTFSCGGCGYKPVMKTSTLVARYLKAHTNSYYQQILI